MSRLITALWMAWNVFRSGKNSSLVRSGIGTIWLLIANASRKGKEFKHRPPD